MNNTNSGGAFLMTGVPGWLGNRFVEFIREGYGGLANLAGFPSPGRIRCLVLPGAELPNSTTDIETSRGDITDMRSMEEFFSGAGGATVFHMASIIHPRNIRQLYDVNVLGAGNVLEMARRSGARKVVYISSNSPCGNGRPGELFDEDSPYRPYMNNGRSKMLAEEIALGYAARHGMDVTVLRPCWFYGPHQPDRQTEFFGMVRAGRFPILGDGMNLRSMSYVDNVCQGMVLSAFTPASRGRIYWAADERPYTMREIVATVADVLREDFSMPVRTRTLRVPSFIGDAAYAADAVIQAVGRYHKKLHVLSEMNKTIACTVARARRELGYAPSVALREGMRRSIAWCLARGVRI